MRGGPFVLILKCFFLSLVLPRHAVWPSRGGGCSFVSRVRPDRKPSWGALPPRRLERSVLPRHRLPREEVRRSARPEFPPIRTAAPTRREGCSSSGRAVRRLRPCGSEAC